MAKVNLGTKWDCYACGRKFYDFGKPLIMCPHCGADPRDPSPETSDEDRVELSLIAGSSVEVDLEDEDQDREDEDSEEGDEEDEGDLDSNDDRPILGEDGDLEEDGGEDIEARDFDDDY